MSSGEYIYTMYKLSRVHPPDKTVLKDISLSFYPGAKIGVLGLNGTGKSTLLRIMAGRDTEFRGEAQLAPGASVGLLEQMVSPISRKLNARQTLINGGQQITRQEALKLYTGNNGWFLREEDRVGTIEAGKRADLVVLDRDYFTVRDEDLKKVHSLMTVVGGRIVHEEKA